MLQIPGMPLLVDISSTAPKKRYIRNTYWISESILTCIISSWGSHPDLRPGERLLALWCRGLQLQQLHSEVSPSLLWWSRCSEEIIFQFQLIIRLHEDPAGSYGFPDTYCNHFMTRWSKTENIFLITIIFTVYRSGKLQEMRVALKVARSGDSGDPSSSCDLLEVETLEHVSDSEI